MPRPSPQIFALLLMIAGCAAPQWLTHKDPAGFSIEAPRGWKVLSDAKTGRVEVRGPEQRVVVWPLFIPGVLNARSAGLILARLSAEVAPEIRWTAPSPAGSHTVRTDGRSVAHFATAALVFVGSTKGTAGYLYAAVAPQATYRQDEPAFSRILASFRVEGAAAKAQSPSFSWVRWTDPRESAFSIEVPQGWRVSGGLFRFASVDTRAAWQAVSPDGVRITGGDADLPPFTEPNPTLAFAGFREGTWYSPGYGVRMFVERYLPGVAFAREYVATKIARGCAGLKITENRDRADAAKAVNEVTAQFGAVGAAVHLTAGEVAFECGEAGQRMAGYYFAGTQRVQVAGMPGGIWNVEHLFGYVAPEAKVEGAQAVLDHILNSIRINPQWAAMQQNVTANTSRIVSQTNAEISRTISSSYWNRQKVMDEISRRRSNAILGVEDIVDPQTGRTMKVESGSNYYWIDQHGTIAGTNTDTRPNLDFRELVRLP